jgi:hypothetical protein
MARQRMIAGVVMLLGLVLIVVPPLLHRPTGSVETVALAVSGLCMSVAGTAVGFMEQRVAVQPITGEPVTRVPSEGRRGSSSGPGSGRRRGLRRPRGRVRWRR